MNVGRYGVKVIASPSGSVARERLIRRRSRLQRPCSQSRKRDWAVHIVTVTVSDFASVPPAPSLTLIEIVAVPESENPGATRGFQRPVPVPGVVVVTVA